MEQLTCKHCLKPKLSTDFYPYQRSKCKQCFADYNNRWVKEHPEYLQQKARRRLLRHRTRVTEANRKRYKEKGMVRSPNYKAVNERYRKTHMFERAVKERLRNEVLSGRLKRSDSCELCSFQCKTQGHHYNYDFPFSVLWLCASCHRLIHGKIEYPVKKQAVDLYKLKSPGQPITTP